MSPLHQTIQTVITLVLLWLGTVFILRRVLPVLTSLFSRHFSVRTVSLRSIRGLGWEYTRKQAGAELVISVRVERLGYKFHRADKARGITSWLTLIVEDVRVVVRDSVIESTGDASLPSSPVSPTSPGSPSSPGSPFGSASPPAADKPFEVPSPELGGSPKPTSALLSPLSPTTLTSLGGGSYFSPDLSPSLRARLWSQYKYSARRLTERWLRSALNCLPDLVKVIDIEVVGPTVCRYIQSGAEDVFGARPSMELEATIAGGLRLHSNIQLSTPPSPSTRRDASDMAQPETLNPWAPSAHRTAKRLRSSAASILERGLGRAAGTGSLVLDLEGDGSLDVRVLSGGDAHQGLKRVSSGLAWFSSIGRDSKLRSDGTTPRRNTSFASLSNVFAPSAASSSGHDSLQTADVAPPLLSLGGPITLDVGHAFGPGVSLLGPGAIKLAVGLDGELVVGLNGLEDVQRRRNKLAADVPAMPARRHSTGKRSNKALMALGNVHVHAGRFRCTYAGAIDSEAAPQEPSSRLPIELVLLGLSIDGRTSDPDTSRLHRDWLGRSPEFRAHAFNAKADSLQVSVQTPEKGDSDYSARAALPSTVCLGAPALEAFTTCFGSAYNCPADLGLVVGTTELKTFEMGVHVSDLERFQALLRNRSQRSRSDAPPHPLSEPPSSLAAPSSAPILPRVFLASILGSCKAELAVPSSTAPDKDHLLTFDCSGASLNVETGLADVPRLPKRASKQPTPLRVWPQDFTAFAEQDIAYHARAAATLRPFEVRLQVASSSDPARSAVDIAPPIFKMDLSEVSGRAVVPGCSSVTWDEAMSSFHETTTLQPSASIGHLHAALGNVAFELWETELVERLADCVSTLSAVRRPARRTDHPSNRPSTSEYEATAQLFRKLPPGLTAYACLAQVDALIAAADPNPACSKRPLRGVWFRSRLVGQYCQLSKHQALQHPTRTASSRTSLQLEEDIIIQGVSHTVQASDPHARTALCSLFAHDAGARPIFNARRFRADGPGATGGFKAYSDMFPARPPLPDKTASLVGWDYQDPKQRDGELPWSSQVRSDPFSLSPAERASTPLRIPLVEVRVVLRHTPHGQPASKHLLAVTVPLLAARLDLSHAWATLVAVEGLKNLRGKPSPVASAPPSPASPSLPARFDVRLDLHVLHADLELPLGERLFLRVRKLSGSVQAGSPILAIDSILAFVPSIRQPTLWDELLSLKTCRLFSPEGGTFSTSFKTGRIRIPYGFKLSQLILNLNITLKSIKHLLALFKSSDFDLLVEPKVQGPKHLPSIRFQCGSLCFEAQDDPIETRLNLIWRVGMAEQSARLEREEAFEAKVAAIARAEGRDHDIEASSPQLSHPSSRWKFGGKHTVGVEEARSRLAFYNSTNYVRRFRNALEEHARKEATHLRQVQAPTKRDSRLPIDISPDTRCSPMFRMTFFGIRISVTPPSFPLDELSSFLHNAGNGLPKDTEFSLLVPLHLSWSMDTARVILRDYPVPLFNLPPLTAADGTTSKAFEFESDLVIGEEMAGPDSFFWIPTAVIPPDLGEKGAAAFALKVAKTIMPVKTYAQPTIKFNSSQVTSWGWGSSMQPGVQDMMKVFETLTHPPRDSSPRIGFWDKLRLVFHWSIEMTFVGPVHIHAKGSRNPYNIVDHGAGFVLAWSGAPHITINKPNRERELVQIEADKLYFAIPDFRGLLDHRATGFIDSKTKEDQDAERELEELDPSALYSKICAKFTNGARAGWGFVMERTCTEDDCKSCSGSSLQRQCRIFDFRPHWEVVLRTPEALENHAVNQHKADSYHGFRSDYIHFSMSIVSPTNRHCPGEDGAPTGYNSFHFSPKGFAHFFAWWRLFGGNMSLPIRQGKLFPNSPPPSKKFGKSLATIKYRFEIAPLFISHLYANDSKSDWDQGLGTYLGVKVKLAKFRADLHQREQERIVTNEKLGRTKKIPHKPFYAADLVLDEIDLRAMSVLCREPEKSEVKFAVDDIQDDPVFTKPTALPDPTWRDRDDLVETDRAPSDDNPRIELHQIGVCPRFTFKKRPHSEPLPRRSKDDGNQQISSSLEETSKFGHEPTHLCHLNQFKDPLQLQIDLARDRLGEVEATLERLRSGRASRKDAEVDGIPVDNDTPADRSLLKKIVLLQDHIIELTKELSTSVPSHGPESELSERAIFQDNKPPESSPKDASPPDPAHHRTAPETWESFDNVFQAHYPHITWSNEARNIVLKYYYHSRARRGFEYHMSALAVKFIREMTVQREVKPAATPTTHHFHPAAPAPALPKKSSKFGGGRHPGSTLANGLLSMLSGDQPEIADSEPHETKRTFVHHENGVPPTPDPWEGLSDGMQIQQNHCFILVKPQIALRSSVDDDSVVIIAAMSTDLMMYGVLDERDLDDPVNSRVMRRSYMTMTSMQAFYPADRTQESSDFVPLEILLDVRSQTDDFERIIPQTSASLQYDKFNQLRLRNTARSMRLSSDLATQDTYHLRHNMDLAIVNIPRLAITSDANQFASLYNIVTNLLLYQDSVQRERNKRLEDFIYSFDHSNLSGATDIVRNLQHRIRVLDRMQTNLRANSDRRRLEHSVELVALKAEKRQLAEELDLLFLAIAAAQDPRESKDKSDRSSFKIEATSSEISWNMLSADKRLLAKMALKHSKFSHLSQKDSSLINEITIKDLQALNGQPDALFPEMLSRYERQNALRGGQAVAPSQPFLNLKFHLLAPVGGISIIQYFGLQLHPVRVQIERKTGRAIMDYFFQDTSSDPSAVDNPKKSKKAVAEVAFDVPQPPPSAGRPSEESARSESVVPDSSSSAPKRSSSSQNLAAAGGPLRPLSRVVSSASIGKVEAASSSNATPRVKRSKSSLSLKEQVEKSQAEEMRSRASHNRTFVYIEVDSSTFVLSYKGDRAKNLTDLHDFRFSTPSFVFHNKTWGFQDLVDELKSQMLKAAWSQKGSLVSQIFTKTGRKASTALGYQQDSGSATSVASSSTTKSPDKSRAWTPSSSAPENLHTMAAAPPAASSPTASSRRSESLLKRTLHLSRSKGSLSEQSSGSESPTSSHDAPYIVVSADSDYESSASSVVSLPTVDLGSEQAKKDALLGRSLGG